MNKYTILIVSAVSVELFALVLFSISMMNFYERLSFYDNFFDVAESSLFRLRARILIHTLLCLQLLSILSMYSD